MKFCSSNFEYAYKCYHGEWAMTMIIKKDAGKKNAHNKLE
jgi:hypothetical protein